MGRIQALARSLRAATGWRRRFMAFGAGAVGALAMAPFDVAPALAITLTTGVWLLDGIVAESESATRRARAAAALGWWLGFGYFVAGLWWLGAAFLVEAEQFAWALPLGVAGLPAVLACFTAAGFAAASLAWRDGPARLLVFALALGASEWLRGILFTGFPWNAFGMAFAGQGALGQSASLFGLHGLTPIAVLVLATPAALADPWKSHRREPVAAVAALALVAMAAFGAVRLSAPPRPAVDGVTIRIMQPNIPQNADFKPENAEAILDRYLALTRAPAPNGVKITHVFWPESAFPFFLAREPEALARIGRELGDRILVTGAARVELATSDRLPGEIEDVSYFNAVHVLGGAGMILDTYDKTHLVPFGEYLPFGKLLERFGLRQFVHIPGGFEPGREEKVLDVPGLPGVAPLICYEAVFPGAISAAMREKIGLIVNVTNDGWFGETAGPYQHLAQARVRAIEEGAPLLRIANTGISALIDPHGRILSRLALGQEGVLDAPLPARLDAPLFAAWPRTAPFIPFAILVVLTLLLARRRR